MMEFSGLKLMCTCLDPDEFLSVLGEEFGTNLECEFVEGDHGLAIIKFICVWVSNYNLMALLGLS